MYPQSRFLGTCTSVTLLVDVKETPQQTPERSFDIIHSVLQTYAGEWHFDIDCKRLTSEILN